MLWNQPHRHEECGLLLAGPSCGIRQVSKAEHPSFPQSNDSSNVSLGIYICRGWRDVQQSEAHSVGWRDVSAVRTHTRGWRDVPEVRTHTEGAGDMPSG